MPRVVHGPDAYWWEPPPPPPPPPPVPPHRQRFVSQGPVRIQDRDGRVLPPLPPVLPVDARYASHPRTTAALRELLEPLGLGPVDSAFHNEHLQVVLTDPPLWQVNVGPCPADRHDPAGPWVWFLGVRSGYPGQWGTNWVLLTDWTCILAPADEQLPSLVAHVVEAVAALRRLLHAAPQLAGPDWQSEVDRLMRQGFGADELGGRRYDALLRHLG